MKYISALFLLALFAHSAFAQRDLIEAIEKTSEGKTVLDGLFLEVAVSGAEINVKNVRARLAAIRNWATANLKTNGQEKRNNKKSCTENTNVAKDRLHDFSARAVSAKKSLSVMRHAQRQFASQLRRTRSLLAMYKGIGNVCRENKKNWSSFWTLSGQNYKRVSALVSQIQAHLRKVHKSNKTAALIEMPSEFTNAMVEITTQFQENFHDLGAISPIMNNLLEVSTNIEAVRNQVVRRSVGTLLKRLRYHLHEQSNKFTEENSHQQALWSELEQLTIFRVQTMERAIKFTSLNANKGAERINSLTTDYRHRTALAEGAANIVDLLRRQCRATSSQLSKMMRNNQRVLNYVEQVEEVVTDRWSSLKSFFLEKLEKSEEDQ